MSEQEKKALVVTADSETRLVFADALTRLGLMPISLPTLAQAKAALGSEPFAVVICEHTLDDGSYRDLLQFVSLSASIVPVVVSSPVADVEVYLEAMQLGAYDFIAFPYRGAELATILNSVLQAHTALSARAVA